jgi:DNA-binding response OmpR family regulator
MHVCLVGPTLFRDPRLLSRLTVGHIVTIAAHTAVLLESPLLAQADALVLEAGSARVALGGTVADIRQRHPNLPVVLVDGGLDQLELAEAFRRGVDDYFAAPWDVGLLAERIEVLGNRQATLGWSRTLNGEK